MENDNAWHKGVPTDGQYEMAKEELGGVMAEFKGTREAFAQALIDVAETDRRIMFVSPDSLKAMRDCSAGSVKV